jgi:hypothetical protein
MRGDKVHHVLVLLDDRDRFDFGVVQDGFEDQANAQARDEDAAVGVADEGMVGPPGLAPSR